MADLADVNVLIALFDPKHAHHARAQTWFSVAQDTGWATCPLTENGFIRIVSNPGYASLTLSPHQLTIALRQIVDTFAASHTFWPDAVSLRDLAMFDLSHVHGHRQLTDVYLLGLCQANGGTLITFDSGALQSMSAVISPSVDLVRVLS